MKKSMKICVGLVLIFAVSNTQAEEIVLTLPEYNSPYHDSGTYYDDYLVGIFTYDLAGLPILSANISGQWGNSTYPNSAHNELWLDGIKFADTHDYTPDPYYNTVTWSYDFDPSEFSVLADGLAEFHTIQTSENIVRLGQTTLTIKVVSASGLSGLVWMPDVPDIAYSLNENNLVYFHSSVPVNTYNITTGECVDPYTYKVTGWIYMDWPFYYILDSGHLMFALPPASGLWVYHFSIGQWAVLPQIIP